MTSFPNVCYPSSVVSTLVSRIDLQGKRWPLVTGGECVEGRLLLWCTCSLEEDESNPLSEHNLQKSNSG